MKRIKVKLVELKRTWMTKVAVEMGKDFKMIKKEKSIGWICQTICQTPKMQPIMK